MSSFLYLNTHVHHVELKYYPTFPLRNITKAPVPIPMSATTPINGAKLKLELFCWVFCIWFIGKYALSNVLFSDWIIHHKLASELRFSPDITAAIDSHS